MPKKIPIENCWIKKLENGDVVTSLFEPENAKANGWRKIRFQRVRPGGNDFVDKFFESKNLNDQAGFKQ